MGRQTGKGIGSTLFSVGIFGILAVSLWFSLTQVNERTLEEGVRVTEQAVRRAALQCYAIEGEYPSSLDYLREEYGLDTGEYIVHYTVIASNLMPDITVFSQQEFSE